MRSTLLRRVRGHGWPSPASHTDAAGLVQLHPPAEGGRVHLGCGEVYLPGYLNVDLPPQQGTASGKSRPDVESNVLSVACPDGTLAEVRLHHLFEHFERAQALALLIRWYRWLAPGGCLTIETPDFEGCIEGFADRPSADRAVILRHIFGSQEAPWALHLDGWSPRRFTEVMGALGFADVTTSGSLSDPKRGLLANVTVRAHRPHSGELTRDEQLRQALAILRESMVNDVPSERQLLARWEQRFRELLDG